MTHPDEFKQGYRHGEMTGAHVSPRQVAEWSPGWSQDQINSYLAGRDDGVANDETRLKMLRLTA